MGDITNESNPLFIELLNDINGKSIMEYLPSFTQFFKNESKKLGIPLVIRDSRNINTTDTYIITFICKFGVNERKKMVYTSCPFIIKFKVINHTINYCNTSSHIFHNHPSSVAFMELFVNPLTLEDKKLID